MRTLEEIALTHSNMAFTDGTHHVSNPHSFWKAPQEIYLSRRELRTIILSALTEATQKSEAQVTEMREALEKIGNAPDTGDHPFLAGGIARAALSPK